MYVYIYMYQDPQKTRIRGLSYRICRNPGEMLICPQDSCDAPRIPALPQDSCTEQDFCDQSRNLVLWCACFSFTFSTIHVWSNLKRKGSKQRHFVSWWFLETSLGKPSALVFSLRFSYTRGRDTAKYTATCFQNQNTAVHPIFLVRCQQIHYSPVDCVSNRAGETLATLARVAHWRFLPASMIARPPTSHSRASSHWLIMTLWKNYHCLGANFSGLAVPM